MQTNRALFFRRSLRCSLVVLIAASAMASRSQAETLQDAFVSAYESNPGLLAARAQLRQTNEQAPQARGAWRPQVTVSGSTGATSVSQWNNDVKTFDDHSYPNTLTLQASQPLYTFGRADARVEAADATIESQRAALFSREQEVLTATASAYMAVLREASVLELQRNNITRLQSQLAATQARFEIEDATRTDVAQAEASLAEARANVENAEAAFAQARAAYMRVVGRPPSDLIQPDLPDRLPDSAAAAAEIAGADNFSLLQARFAEAAADHQKDAAESELLPSVDLTVDVNRSENASGQDNKAWIATASVRVSVPLYQSGVSYSKAREAHENLRRLRYTAVEQERVVQEEASSAFEAFQGSYSQLDALQAQIDAATVALQGVTNEASIGVRTVLDVLDAEQALLDARVRLVRARYDVVVNAYRLLASVGRLTAQGLGLPVAYYDYDRHYVETHERWFGLDTADDAYFKD